MAASVAMARMDGGQRAAPRTYSLRQQVLVSNLQLAADIGVYAHGWAAAKSGRPCGAGHCRQPTTCWLRPLITTLIVGDARARGRRPDRADRNLQAPAGCMQCAWASVSSARQFWSSPARSTMRCVAHRAGACQQTH
jgi:hypothetical protein